MKINKYQKIAQEATNEILIDDIEYGIKSNNNAKRAIYSSISQGVVRVDEGYIKEKLNAVKDVDKWLQYYIREAKLRCDAGNLSMSLMQRFGDVIESSKNLFKN